jgi:hypothetical protein
MTGGLKKTTSRLAIATIASVVASGAFAADLGGNCCADLEERVAELEATTARKGNRKVKLTVSGHVNEALIFWDDGFEKNQYVVSNNNSRTRFRFVGDAKINDRLSAGYLIEIGLRYANSGSRNQTTPGGGSNANQVDIRHSAWWMEYKDLGRVWVGKTSTATDGITEINLANVNTIGSGDAWIGGFFLRNANNSLSTQKWNNITPSFIGAWNDDGDRNTTVRYVSPTLHGFTFSSAWGEDDYWDTAVRYAGEFNGIRIAAGIGYKQQNDNPGKTGSDGDQCADLNAGVPQVSTVDCHVISGSASVMHVPTGLFLSGSYARYTDENRKALYGNIAGIKDEDTYWYLLSGIEQNWFGFGKTTLYGEYGRHETGAGLGAAGATSCGNFGAATGSATVPGSGVSGGLGCLSEAEVDLWGLGINQEISAAAMDMYIAYRHFDPTLKTSATGSTTGQATAGIKEFDAVMMGAIIRF